MKEYVEYIGLPGSGKTTLLSSKLRTDYSDSQINNSISTDLKVFYMCISLLIPLSIVMCLALSPRLLLKPKDILSICIILFTILKLRIIERSKSLVYDQLVFQRIFILQCRANTRLIRFLFLISAYLLTQKFQVKIIYLNIPPNEALSRLRERQLKVTHNATQFDNISDDLALIYFKRCVSLFNLWPFSEQFNTRNIDIVRIPTID